MSSSLEQVYEDSIQRYQAIVDSADAQYRAEPDPQLSHLYRVTAKRYRKKVLCTQKELSDWIQHYQAVVNSADAQYRVSQKRSLNKLLRSLSHVKQPRTSIRRQQELSDCMDCMSPPSFTPLSARSQQQDLGQVAQPSGPTIPRVSILISFLIVVPLLLGLNFFDKHICPSLNPSNPVLKFCR